MPYFFVLVFLSLHFSGWTVALAADTKPAAPAQAAAVATSLVVKVQGMVCAFCAQGIKKNFNALEQVESTEVDLDKMEVHLKLKPGKTLDAKVVESVITEAGFKFVGIQ